MRLVVFGAFALGLVVPAHADPAAQQPLKANKRVHALGDLLEDLLPTYPRVAKLLQFLVFVGLGTVIGKIAVDPYTQLQAFAGGVAWSRLAAKD